MAVIYCGECGVMKLKGETGPCKSCGSEKRTLKAPRAKTVASNLNIPTPIAKPGSRVL